MTANNKAIDNIADLRKELSAIPKVRLQFAKAMTDLLATHNISLSGDFLGKLTIASCDEVVGHDKQVLGVWTN